MKEIPSHRVKPTAVRAIGLFGRGTKKHFMIYEMVSRVGWVLQPPCQRTTHHLFTQHTRTKEIPSHRVKPTHARCKTIMALKKKPTNDTYFIYTSKGSFEFCLFGLCGGYFRRATPVERVLRTELCSNPAYSDSSVSLI